MAQHKKRNYEVSIWTLQDEFITILKPSNVENKGQISEGKTIIKDDGTLELSFSIPMYYYEGKTRIANPIWYTTKNGMIVQDMRKIKLIFNKDTDFMRVFEFLIVDVKENHKNDTLACDINTEGMIFNELGKWGYKISLSSEEFYARDYDFFTNGEWKDDDGVKHTKQPRGTLQYWLNHFLTPLPADISNLDITKWYYKVEMDWSAYSSDRDSNKVYEDEYTGSWSDTGSGYIPKEIVAAKEKERMVDLEESNAYNLTQNLAETFGVFCRYEYLYDSNYHIIGRVVIFYNNYIRENEGYLDITYPYSTSAITRQRDSKDVTTKMFVRPVTDDTSSSGLITILDVGANKSREDYLLNFDYLRTVGGVTEDQYAEIDNYEYQVGKCNNLLKNLEGPLITLRNRVPELEAAVTLHTNAIQLDKERISASNDLLNDLDKKDGEVDGTVSIKSEAPRTAILKQSSNTDNNGAYYIDLTDHGIVLQTLHIYRSYNFTNKTPSEELTTGTPEYDEFGNIIKINNLFIADAASRTVYLTYNYVPKLYYDRVLRTWQSRLGTDEAALAKTQNELAITQNRIENLQTQYDNTLTQKRKLVAAFDRMMGPALRESYWQPDNYTDYGDNYIDTLRFSTMAASSFNGTSGYTQAFWDAELFDDEQRTTYEYTATQAIQFYPCIRLGKHLNYIKEHIDELSFMFYDYVAAYPTGSDMHNIRNFPVGSLCQYGFIKNGSAVEPVLILTGIEGMSAEQIEEMKLRSHSPKIGVLTTTVTSNGINTEIKSFFDVDSSMWITSSTPVYPRIKVSSLALKTSNDMLGLTYNATELKNYEDYYILVRDNGTVNSDGAIGTSDAAYYITIKPEIMLREGLISAAVKFKFNLSNADTAIYLDAIQVLKENAYPKVSYTIDSSVIDEDFLYTLYNKLNCICNINDTELKLENVQGYISELELDLDKPENDHIEIKNYKTKFEDLFTSIVAQTEAMKKSAYTIGLAAQAFTSAGDINADVLQNSVMKVDLNYAFNNGKLTIDEKNGIWGTSDSGVVAFRGGGIFTATEKDTAGNWKWNTGIVPQGINADLISTGQLDTNRINIYAGDRVRFQLNGEGLFAYKSFFEDFDINSLSAGARSKIDAASKRIDDLDAAQYVVMNQNGLFLVGEAGALVLNRNKTDYIKLNKTVKRVEVSWEGFKLRNWDDKQVFWADPDTGNLYVAGTVFADEFNILNTRTDIGVKAPVSLNKYLNIQFEDHVKVSEGLGAIFNEAGNIIHNSLTSISNLENLTINNSKILENFYNDIKAGLKDNRTIKLYGSSSVDIYSGDITDPNSTSVLSVSKDRGVWIGSGKEVNLFSGAINNTTNVNRASVSLSPSKILFGVSNIGTSSTAVEMTDNYIIMATGININSLRSNIPINNNLTGIKITKDGIWLATGTSSNRSLISMIPGSIIIGIAAQDGTNKGNFIELSQTQMKIGSSTDIYIKATNIELTTINGNNKNLIGFRLGLEDKPSLTLKGYDLYIAGTIYANEFYVLNNRTDKNPILLKNFLNTQFEDHVKVSNSLEEIFNEVGDLLEQASSTLNGLDSTTTVNYTILQGFLNKVKNLNPVVTTEKDHPINFKPGDIWEPATGTYAGNKYIAISFSDKVTGSNPLAGWNRTYDGSLASITGAGIDIDAAAGTIDMYSGSRIRLRAKSYLELASGDIQITGNNSINIGSKWINIGSTSGINIVNAIITNNTSTESNGKVGTTSRVTIDTNGILMHSSNIELMATESSSIAALSLNPNTGVYIGSGRAIQLYSGNIGTNANVMLSPAKILFGVSNTSSSTTAVEMTENYLIIASGDNIASLRGANIPGSNNNLTGVKVTKDGFYIATGNTSSGRSLISITPMAVEIGTVSSTGNNGSFIKLSKSEMKIGASTKFYINTDNIGLDTLQGNSGIGFRLGPVNNPKLVFKNGNLSITGAITATSLYIGDFSIDEYIDGKIPVIPEIPDSSYTFYQADEPIGTYKKGDLWYRTGTGDIYIAQNNHTVEGTSQWILFNTKINGTKLFVNGESGYITIRAESFINITTGQILNLDCHGSLYVRGEKGIIFTSTGNIDFYGGNSINMYANGQTRVAINANGIALNGPSIAMDGGNITLNGGNSIEFKTGGVTDIALNTSGIVMNTAGKVELRGTSGIINFGTDPENPAFSVDNTGVVMCSKIICSGEITGTIPSSGSGTNTDPYVLYFNESNSQERTKNPQTRQTAFKTQNSAGVASGDYTCSLCWGLVCIYDTMRDVKITVNFINSDGTKTVIYQDTNGTTWEHLALKEVLGGNNAVIHLNNNMQILNFETIITYRTNTTGKSGSRWDGIYSNTVTLTPA